MLRQVHLPGVSDDERTSLVPEFPTLHLELGAPPRDAALVDARELFVAGVSRWHEDLQLGEAIERHGRLAIANASGRAATVLTRYQRFVDRRNLVSADGVFDRVLERHRALHVEAGLVDRPLVRADFDHARDVWQWLLRLSPSATRAVQVAALFHDIERLESEPVERIEQRAGDYQAFKDAHAQGGARLLERALADVLEPDTLARAARLVAGHERPGDDGELALLNDADALSFFSLNSPGFLDYYGPEHTKKKIAFTLARLSPGAKMRLEHIGLRDDVRTLVEEMRR